MAAMLLPHSFKKNNSTKKKAHNFKVYGMSFCDLILIATIVNEA
jgi:hypothetical protein